MFFDEQGQEIIRVASVIRFYRLRKVLNYVLTGAYKEQPEFLFWGSQREQLEAQAE